jgi:hypothetical protein
MNDQNRSSAVPGADRRERMQRIRVGLTGLAVVLMLVFVATLVFTRLRVPEAANNMVEASANEPLADLGIAPGAASDNETKAPAPAK